MIIVNGKIAGAELLSEEKLALLNGKHILSADQFTMEELEVILEVSAYYELKMMGGKPMYDMARKVAASLFFEPSTRTRLSFETAMHRLGGSVITVAESTKVQTSSTAKGETLADSIKVVDSYADVIILRSPQKGAADEAASVAVNPVINSGDGAGEHPTQALLDIYTIFKEKGRLEGLTVTLLGDLKYGRTVHSLILLLSLYGCSVNLVAPAELQMPGEIIAEVSKKGIAIKQTEHLVEAVQESDVLYVTRIQKERFNNESDYDKVKDDYIVDSSIINKSKQGIVVMHPLPRVNEITLDVDQYPGAAYFRQAANGVPIRMALLALVKGSVI